MVKGRAPGSRPEMEQGGRGRRFFVLSRALRALGIIVVLVSIASLVDMNAELYILRQSTTTSPINKNVTYGHIHMAKTGGTSLNGMLALSFERVCGHKGYSYDYFQANKRFNNTAIKVDDLWKIEDLLTPLKDFNRGRVPVEVMDAIGYEDCDWISHEAGYDVWRKFSSWYNRFELHLPCREPIEHLMSQCNHRGINFNCNTTNLEREIDACVMELNRFNIELVNGSISPGEVKCYDTSHQFTKYLSHMGKTLQRKKITAKYIHRDTNSNRNKSDECIWEASETFKEIVTAVMKKKYHYYSFCDTCVGSRRDLFADIIE